MTPTQTEIRNVILETIGQLGKFVDMMHEYEEEGRGYSDDEVKLLKILHSFANQTKHFGKGLVRVDKVTDETISK